VQDISAELLGFVGAIVVVVGFLALAYLFSFKVEADERVVVYQFGKTRPHLIEGAGARAFVFPLVNRAVHVKGELGDAWWELRKVLPRSWWVAAPQHDEWGGGWSVSAGAPSGASERLEASATGGTQAEALLALAERIPEVLQGDGGGRALGEDPPPAWRRYLRNPYRLPIHGNHFFLLPESWYDEHGDTGRYSRNGMLATIDMLAAIMPPFLVAALLWASVGG
jgi:hypothetical protein